MAYRQALQHLKPGDWLTLLLGGALEIIWLTGMKHNSVDHSQK